MRIAATTIMRLSLLCRESLMDIDWHRLRYAIILMKDDLTRVHPARTHEANHFAP